MCNSIEMLQQQDGGGRLQHMQIFPTYLFVPLPEFLQTKFDDV